MSAPGTVELPLALLSIYGDIIVKRSAWSWPDLQAIPDQSEFLDHFKISADQYTQLQQYASTRRSVGAFQPVSPSSDFLKTPSSYISPRFSVMTPNSATSILPGHDESSPTPKPKESSSSSNVVHGLGLFTLDGEDLTSAMHAASSEPRSSSQLFGPEIFRPSSTEQSTTVARPSERCESNSRELPSDHDSGLSGYAGAGPHSMATRAKLPQVSGADRRSKVEKLDEIEEHAYLEERWSMQQRILPAVKAQAAAMGVFNQAPIKSTKEDYAKSPRKHIEDQIRTLTQLTNEAVSSATPVYRQALAKAGTPTSIGRALPKGSNVHFLLERIEGVYNQQHLLYKVAEDGVREDDRNAVEEPNHIEEEPAEEEMLTTGTNPDNEEVEDSEGEAITEVVEGPIEADD